MIPDDDQIRALVARPGENLTVEIKRWVDPADPGGAAKIVKAAFALRNRNGGFLVIGFDDTTLQPDLANEPADVRGTFSEAIRENYSKARPNPNCPRATDKAAPSPIPKPAAVT